MTSVCILAQCVHLHLNLSVHIHGCIYILYIKPVVSQSSAEGDGVVQPGRKTVSLLMFATSVSKSSLLPVSFWETE